MARPLSKSMDIVNCSPENKLQWNLNRNLYIFNQENVIWERATFLARPQCVKVSFILRNMTRRRSSFRTSIYLCPRETVVMAHLQNIHLGIYKTFQCCSRLRWLGHQHSDYSPDIFSHNGLNRFTGTEAYCPRANELFHPGFYASNRQLHNHAPTFYQVRWLVKVTRHV